MKLQNKIKIIIFLLLITINVILRFQVPFREIGFDSFMMHLMANSISEFGYAKWILHPLSFMGLYPASYTSAMQFLLSGISQSTNIEMKLAIFIYCQLIGILSIFTAYIMAGEIINDDFYKILTAIGYSMVPAILGYTTFTVPTRGLLIVLAPLLLYIILKIRTQIKYILLIIIFSPFLLSVHHLFYFLIPSFFISFVQIIHLKLNKYLKPIKISDEFAPFIIVTVFVLMFSIPFFTGRFIDSSRYSPIYVNYLRWTGLFLIPAIGGLLYLIFKHEKSFGEWFLLLNMMLLTTFIYYETYLQSFIPIFLIPLASISLINISRLKQRKVTLSILVIFLIMSISFSGYFQFVNDYEESSTTGRAMGESTYFAGKWIRGNISGNAISNDRLFGMRIFSESQTTHILSDSTVVNQIYGFNNINISDYIRYPYTSENFFFSGYYGPDIGQIIWEDIHMLRMPPTKLNITHFIENVYANGNLVWNHGNVPSKLLLKSYNDRDLLYDDGKAKIWEIN